jgi:hypothetical protein
VLNKMTKRRTRRKGGGLNTGHAPELLLELIQNATTSEFNAIADIWNIHFPSALVNRESKNAFLFHELQQHSSFAKMFGTLTLGTFAYSQFVQRVNEYAPTEFVENINNYLPSNMHFRNALRYGPLVMAATAKLGMSISNKLKSYKTAKILDGILKRLKH